MLAAARNGARRAEAQDAGTARVAHICVPGAGLSNDNGEDEALVAYLVEVAK